MSQYLFPAAGGSYFFGKFPADGFWKVASEYSVDGRVPQIFEM
jgi:hypothetical protein